MYSRSRASKNRCSRKSVRFQNEISEEPQFYEPDLLVVKISEICILSVQFYAWSKFCVINTISFPLGYVYTGSDLLRSVWDGIGSTMVRIHSVYTAPVRNWNGTIPYGITLISGPIWYQTADPIRTGSTRSRVNARLIRTNFVPVPNGSGPV